VAFTRHDGRAIREMRYHGHSRLAGILFLAAILVELDGAGANGIWARLNRLSDDQLRGLLAAIAADRRHVLDERLERLRRRVAPLSAERLAHVERSVDADDAEPKRLPKLPAARRVTPPRDVCGTPLVGKRSDAKYCSQDCAQKARWQREKRAMWASSD
jgi:hypothetical protein